MAEVKERFPDWVRDTRLPNPPPPPNSCDSQFHIYDDTGRFPPKWKIGHELPRANFAEAREMLRRLGFERGILVHASVYDTDYGLLFDSLRQPGVRDSFRGVVVLKDDVSDATLQELQQVGVCGVRFHIAQRYEPYPKDALLRTLHRISELGWHARLHLDPPDLLEYSDVLTQVKDLPIVIDHMGRVDFARGLEQPVCRWIFDRLRNDNWWMMVSNGNRTSAMEEGWDDAVPFGQAYIAAAPDRTIWATDWPHVRWRKQRMMNDAEEVELLYRYVDHDPALIQAILVDNPARLHGF
jgi:2-pyrone-4,6-dicarboxylate lactonase